MADATEENDPPVRENAETDVSKRFARRLRILRQAVLLLLCTALIVVLVLVVSHPGIPEFVRALIAVAVIIAGAGALHLAYPENKQLLGVAAGILTIVATLLQVSGNATTVTRYKQWAPCPRTEKPMAMIDSDAALATQPKRLRGKIGIAHIDNVIAPDGTANVKKLEKACVTIEKYPSHGRTLWLILRLRLPAGAPIYPVFYAVGEFSDPAPGRYSVSIDRSCTAMPPGSRHTLLVVSAPPRAAEQLWKNYNARVQSNNTNCNTAGDKTRGHLPSATYRVSNQGDVIQGTLFITPCD